jgi:hypothetical protein
VQEPASKLKVAVAWRCLNNQQHPMVDEAGRRIHHGAERRGLRATFQTSRHKNDEELHFSRLA